MSDESKWVTVKEAALYLKVSPMTLFRWMKSGKLTHYKMGSSVRLTKADLDALAQPSGSNLPSPPLETQNEPPVQDTLKAQELPKEEFCLMCGYDDLIDGYSQSTGRMYFKPLKTRFWTFAESTIPVSVKMCGRCGFLHQFADTNKMEKLNPKD